MKLFDAVEENLVVANIESVSKIETSVYDPEEIKNINADRIKMGLSEILENSFRLKFTITMVSGKKFVMHSVDKKTIECLYSRLLSMISEEGRTHS